MGKRYRKMERKVNGRIREVSDCRVVLELPLPVAEVLSGMTEAVESLSREAGLKRFMRGRVYTFHRFKLKEYNKN